MELRFRNECIILDKTFILSLSCINSSTKYFQRNFEYTDIYNIQSMALWQSYKYLVGRGGRERLFEETNDYGTSAITYNVSIHTVKWMMIKNIHLRGIHYLKLA